MVASSICEAIIIALLTRRGKTFMACFCYNSSPMKPYCILAYYHFVPLADPHEEVALHTAFLGVRDATARIYLSESGINGQLCIHEKDAPGYIHWMQARPEFREVIFKMHRYPEHVFPRLTI